MAVLSFFLMVGAFPSVGLLAEWVIRTTRLILSPNYTGCEVARTIDHGAYQAQVHRVVFDHTLIGERRKGFIQVDWGPVDDPRARIDEEVDADGDGHPDSRMDVNTANNETTLTPYASWVLDPEGTYRLENSLTIRVRLRNPSRRFACAVAVLRPR
jgi:hypothetical protein